MCLADTIRRNIDQGRFTGVGLINLRNVFDTVNHEVLLSKLRGLGVVDGEQEWFTNYQQNRTEIVENQGVSSAAELVCVGVPRRSILGPLLFIHQMNDLPSAVVECSVLLFTDDTVVFFSALEVSFILGSILQ